MKLTKKFVTFALAIFAFVSLCLTTATLMKAKADTAFVMDDKAVIRVITPPMKMRKGTPTA